jgi:predicted ATPase/DNA-binding winged helix-turn-helix (wHTH) protein
LWHSGEQIAVPLKCFSVLRYLVENPGRLITHDELLDALWPETYVQPQVLRTYVLELRKLLGDDAGSPRFIQTLPKRGYCFVARVSDSQENPGQPERRRASDKPAKPDSDPLAQSPIGGRSREINVSAITAREIVGRDSELAQLAAEAQLAAAGQRRVCFVTGESGIGKTSLMDTFCRRSDLNSDACVARGQCVEGFGSREEYYPVMEALSHLCGSPDGERVCRVLARVAPAWLSALGRDCGLTVDAVSLKRMPGDLCLALEELAAECPLVLVFEDMQWADEATLHLLSALARRRAQARLMMIATYRPWVGRTDAAAEYADRAHGAENAVHALKQDLFVRRLCTEIALRPLSRGAVRELLIQELQHETIPATLSDFVHHRSEGNPLFVLATLEHLIAEGVLARSVVDGQSAWTLVRPLKDLQTEKGSVPGSLEQMIELEIGRLNAQEQRLLEGGSLVSFVFSAWTVAAALEQDVEATEEALDDLARRLPYLNRAGVDELPDGTCSAFYVFAHELYREVLYHRQTATRRARRHCRVATKLGELFAENAASVASEMAQHYEAAGDWKHAVDALRVAADHAHGRRAALEAAALLDHAARVAANLPQTERAQVQAEIREHPAFNLQNEAVENLFLGTAKA